MTSANLLDYINEVSKLYETGRATEHSYRPSLKKFLETILEIDITTEMEVINEPSRIACGAPDYLIMCGMLPVCYIEAKDLGTDLQAKHHQQQFLKYIKSLDYLIITDYLEFDFYEKQVLVDRISLGRIEKGKILSMPENLARFMSVLRTFAHSEAQVISKSKKLAEIMASKAKLMAEVINGILTDATRVSSFHLEKTEFQEYLIKDISDADFADLYAQTITYGMFAARNQSRMSSVFDRRSAAELIPRSNPFLRRLFQNIAVFDLDDRFAWIVDDLAESFRVSDMESIMGDLGDQDPIIHFYEYFLSAYNPELRKSRGVYYTPKEVVSFIVRAVDEVLVYEFGLADGLGDVSRIGGTGDGTGWTASGTVASTAPTDGNGTVASTAPTDCKLETDGTEASSAPTGQTHRSAPTGVHRVQILDPATGTGTFLAETIRQIYEKFKSEPSVWQSYVDAHLLPRLHGFEVMMAPYTMAHLNINWSLLHTGYENDGNHRLKIYLTNSLEEYTPGHNIQHRLFSEESVLAGSVKVGTPLMVVLGNPPYSGESQNSGEWISQLVGSYKQEPGGGPLKERNSKWLNDDYVKFIRFGQHFIEQQGEGILALITNHSFLDNPTFRGMRSHLLGCFTKMYILDLHGNSIKQETRLGAVKDENVFNIKPGVCISLFIKTKGDEASSSKTSQAEVFHYDVYGSRKDKFSILGSNSLSTIPFVRLNPAPPFYFFVPKDFSGRANYEKGFSLSELFHLKSAGVITARDDLTIHLTPQRLEKTIKEFLRQEPETARETLQLGKDKRDWTIVGAQAELRTLGSTRRASEINYRPFDKRFTYYTGQSRGFHCMPRGEVMRHFMNGPNVGLCLEKIISNKSKSYSEIFITSQLADGHLLGGCTYIFPLYLIPKKEGSFMEPNLNMSIVKKLARKIGCFDQQRYEEYSLCDNSEYLTPLNILDYIYGVLYSPKYREKYNEFMKIDFPRLPYPEDAHEYWSYVSFGSKLRKLHLLQVSLPAQPLFPLRGSGSNVVDKVKYENLEETVLGESGGKIYINEHQYFDHVPSHIWEFYIGGYQPAQKWLKDRQGELLSYDDIRHYQQILYVLGETYKIQQRINLC